MNDITKVAIAVVGLATVATLVVNGPNTAKAVGAVSGGFSNSITAAEKG